MTKEKRQTLNADKRKVIADVFQSHFEDNSKYKKQHQDAITNYNLMREQAKVKMNDLVRFHQPQEDVDTIRKMIENTIVVVGIYTMIIVSMFNLIHLVWTKITMVIQKKFMMKCNIKFELIVIFLTSYYRDELNAKGLDADYDVRVDNSGKDKSPTYYKAETNVKKSFRFWLVVMMRVVIKCITKMNGKMTLRFGLLEHHIVIVDNSKLKTTSGLISLSQHRKM